MILLTYADSNQFLIMKEDIALLRLIQMKKNFFYTWVFVVVYPLK